MKCPECNGEGRVPFIDITQGPGTIPCQTCGGTGEIINTIEIPTGIKALHCEKCPCCYYNMSSGFFCRVYIRNVDSYATNYKKPKWCKAKLKKEMTKCTQLKS